MKVIAIDSFDRCLKSFDVPLEAVELIPDGLMSFACWLNDSDALCAVEQLIVRQYFCVNGEVIFGVGMVVGHDRNGDVLEAPSLTGQDIAKAVIYGSAHVLPQGRRIHP